ncbi:MAG: outer membrane beta-barrel protein [Steroidobacteraceae bacterium]
MNLKILIAFAALLATSLACADELPFFQVAAHGGYRAGGSFEDSETGESFDLADGTSLALALEFRFGKGDDRFLQLWYSHQSSSINDGVADHDVDVEYLHFGGTVPIGDMEKAQGYFVMGIGATRFSASGTGAEDQTKFSASMGLGLAIPVSRRAAIRLEARGYVTFVDSDTSVFCRSDNGTGFCRIVASGSAIYQAEALAGIAVSF